MTAPKNVYIGMAGNVVVHTLTKPSKNAPHKYRLVDPNEQSDIEVIHNGDQGEKTLLRDDNLIGWVLRLMDDNLYFQPAAGLCELSPNELRLIADIIDLTEKEIKESE